MYKIIRFEEKYEKVWNDFQTSTGYQIFQFNRAFLNYDLDGIIDCSYIILEENKVVALFPAAYLTSDPTTIISHPRSSFGGLLYTRSSPSKNIPLFLNMLFKQFSLDCFVRCRIKNIPYIYSKYCNGELGYFLKRAGGLPANTKLSAVIYLQDEIKFASRRTRIHKKNSEDINISSDRKHLYDYWGLLQRLLNERYGSEPVHSYGQICELLKLFPDNVDLMFAIYKGVVIGGLVIFKYASTVKAQYIASNDLGKLKYAVDKLILNAISFYRQYGYKYFDLGTSNGCEGNELNSDLFEFKYGFGAGGLEYYDYEFKKI